MSYAAHRFIDPRTLAAIHQLSLLAKTVVDGFMLGWHRSRQTGAGMEFNQYRSYQPGDDPRRIDWKLFARSDRYYVRESEVETSLSVRFVLDASASMRHEEEGLSKFDYARFLVASLGYLAHEQGDAIGLHVLNDGHRTDLPAPPYVDPQHLHRFLHTLDTVEARGRWPAADPRPVDGQDGAPVFAAGSRRGLVVLVSDMHELDDEITEALLTLRMQKNEVLLFHVLGRQEATFAYEGRVTFEDLETGRRVHVDADAARGAVRAAQQRAFDALRQTLHDRDVVYQQMMLDEPLDEALRHYLVRRMNLLRR